MSDAELDDVLAELFPVDGSGKAEKKPTPRPSGAAEPKVSATPPPASPRSETPAPRPSVRPTQDPPRVSKRPGKPAERRGAGESSPSWASAPDLSVEEEMDFGALADEPELVQETPALPPEAGEDELGALLAQGLPEQDSPLEEETPTTVWRADCVEITPDPSPPPERDEAAEREAELRELLRGLPAAPPDDLDEATRKAEVALYSRRTPPPMTEGEARAAELHPQSRSAKARESARERELQAMAEELGSLESALHAALEPRDDRRAATELSASVDELAQNLAAAMERMERPTADADALFREYRQRLGGLDHIPRLKMSLDVILGHRVARDAAELAALVDGRRSYRQLISRSGLSGIQAAYVLVSLKEEGLIG